MMARGDADDARANGRLFMEQLDEAPRDISESNQD